jgi:biotin synthase-related radical SAM superfamily protein
VKQGQAQISGTVTRLEQGQAQTNANLAQTNTTQGQVKTLVEAVAAGQKELQETVETKADVLTVGVKVDKLRKRIEGIEEHTGSPNPHKN